MTLPIEEVLPRLRAVLAAHPAAVLQAPPGAGKTTLVPLALLDEPWLKDKSIVMLEPRRLAARAAAGRMSQLRGENAGETVGYRIRFESKVSKATRIEVLTEGILTRRLQNDPALEGVGLVIFDEFHERHLHADLALALCLDSQRGLRDDLRILVMSATLDGAAVSRLLNNAPIITSEGRSFPVSVKYLPRDPEGRLPITTAAAVQRALEEQAGDALVFLPGAREIRQTQELLTPALGGDIEVLPLYGDLPWESQQRAIQPGGGRRRVVLATPIAETSLTIEGVRIIVDAGFARVPQFDPVSGLTRLVTQRISRASAEQRAGRAGRTAPGVCYRLWSETTQRGLIPQATPEIKGADLAPLARRRRLRRRAPCLPNWMHWTTPGASPLPATHWRSCRCTRAWRICCEWPETCNGARLPATSRRCFPNAISSRAKPRAVAISPRESKYCRNSGAMVARPHKRAALTPTPVSASNRRRVSGGS
jgi:ATP-dependent helicase HrpB